MRQCVIYGPSYDHNPAMKHKHNCIVKPAASLTLTELCKDMRRAFRGFVWKAAPLSALGGTERWGIEGPDVEAVWCLPPCCAPAQGAREGVPRYNHDATL